MRKHHLASTDIDAPAARVWQVVTDVARWPEIVETVTSVEALTPGPLGTGSRYRVVQPRLPASVWSVTAVLPGRSFRWVAPNTGIVTTADHTVVPLDEHRSRLQLAIEHRGPLAWLGGRLTHGLTEDYLGKECAGIKRAAEGTAG